MQKLELTWVEKDKQRQHIEPRILIENPEYSYGKVETGVLPNGKPWNGNMLIHGDNLLALKALEQEYSGQIKCIYIDPPYNTGSAFEHYDDMKEHSTWLSLMKERLELLHNLLSLDGVMFISIDDYECHYLKVLLDEIFGRKNYTGSFNLGKKKKPSFLSKMGSVTEYILTYAKSISHAPAFVFGHTTVGKKYPFNNAGNGLAILTFPKGTVKFNMKDCHVSRQDMSEGAIITELLDDFDIVDGYNSSDFRLKGEWRYSQDKLNEIIKNHEPIVISKIPFRPNHVKSGGDPKKIKNLLSIAHYNISTYEDSTKESISLFGNNPFDYPKPEKLISVLINAVTNQGDLILDSFLGSGTTAAVAHKMGRKYIGVELGEHAYTHCYPRLQKVIDGEDNGGITQNVNWKGGGGFKFYELAPSLLEKDKYGQMVINKEYNANMLAAAMAKHEGFTYSPSNEFYWKQGQSSEQDFIYTTTQFLTVEALDRIYEEMADGESLLICCTAFQKECLHAHSNISIKKIPKMLLGRCEFGVDNYNLNIINVPEFENDDIDSEIL
jgi:Adenine specific DNA methylase Mod